MIERRYPQGFYQHFDPKAPVDKKDDPLVKSLGILAVSFGDGTLKVVSLLYSTVTRFPRFVVP